MMVRLHIQLNQISLHILMRRVGIFDLARASVLQNIGLHVSKATFRYGKKCKKAPPISHLQKSHHGMRRPQRELILTRNSIKICTVILNVFRADLSYLRLFSHSKTNISNKLAGSRRVGYLQATPRSRTRDHLEQIQLVTTTGLELGTARFQVPRPSHLVTLPCMVIVQLEIT